MRHRENGNFRSLPLEDGHSPCVVRESMHVADGRTSGSLIGVPLALRMVMAELLRIWPGFASLAPLGSTPETPKFVLTEQHHTLDVL